jgi:hypothetical protein
MGIQTDHAQRKWEEERQDEMIKLKCLELIMADGLPTDKATPWYRAQKLYLWVKYNNPDMQVL